MTDLASLIIEIDSSQVPKGTAALDQLTASGKKAENELGAVARQSRTASQAASDLAAKTQAAARSAVTTGSGFNRMGGQARLSSFQVQNLGFQLNDLFVSLASGQNPMRVFIQQGSQIAQIGAQSGLGLGGMARAALGLVAPFALAATGLGLLATAFLGVKQAAASDAELQRYAQSLGLTKKEMEELTDVTVTWGDVTKATFDVLAESAGTSSEEITSFFGSAFRSIGEFGKFSAGVILGAFAAAIKGVVSLMSNVPGIVGNAVISAANMVIAALEGMVNNGVASINLLTSGVNSALGTSIPQIAAVSLGRIETKFQGSFGAIGKDIKDQFFGTFNDIEKGFDRISSRATERAKGRLRNQADNIIGDRDGKGAGGGSSSKERAKGLNDEAKAYDTAMKAAQAYLDQLTKETDGIGQNAVMSKRMEVATAAAAARKAAAVAPTKEMRDALLAEARAIEEAGRSWERVYNQDRIQQFIKNTVEPLEFENSLIGKSIAIQRIMRAERELTAQSVARGSAEWNRYIQATNAAIANDNQIAMQQRVLDWADRFSGAITDVITGTSSLKEAFGNLARSIIADLVKMIVKAMIFRALSAAFGLPGGGGGGINVSGATGDILGGFFGRATGGPVSEGKPYRVGERGPELFIPRQSGTIVPNGAMGGSPQKVTVELVGFTDAMKLEVRQGAAEVVQAAAPAIMGAARQSTVRTLQRRRIS